MTTVSETDAGRLHTLRFRAMGSPCQIRLYAENPGRANHVGKILQKESERLELKYSRYRQDSLLSSINHSAGTDKPVTIDRETSALLDYADTCHEQSGGLFDISAGILRHCWKFGSDSDTTEIPEQAEIERLKARIGWKKIHYTNSEILLPRGMEIDLGGVVKEYAADCMATLARQSGIRHGLIELGGDICVIGPHPGKQPWIIGISHPLNPQQALASIELSDGALATSGTYQRCFQLQGKQYHHILSPLTGWPVSGMASVSVVASHCLIAGSAATIALLKESRGREWLERLELPWLGIEHDLSVSGSLSQ